MQWDGEIGSIDAVVAAMSSLNVRKLDLSGHLSFVRSRHQAPAGCFLVWRAVTTGCSIHSSQLELPEGSVLLLAGHGVHFHDVTFKGEVSACLSLGRHCAIHLPKSCLPRTRARICEQAHVTVGGSQSARASSVLLSLSCAETSLRCVGGVVICAGPQHSGTFQNCKFDDTAVYIVHGAAAMLHHCRFFACQPGLTASGGATAATLASCTFDGCPTGIVAECGASVIAHGCRLTRTSAAVVSNGPGTRVTLQHCVIANDLAGARVGTAATARGGTLLLRSCRLQGFTIALTAIGRTTSVEADTVTFTDSPQGAMLSTYSRAAFRRCTFLCDRSGPKVQIPMAVFLGTRDGVNGGGRAQLERCRIKRGTVRGISLQDDGAVAARLCRFDCTEEVLASGRHGGHAALAHCTGVSTGTRVCVRIESPAGLLRLDGGSYEGSTVACLAERGARLSAAGCELSSRGVRGDGGVVIVREKACARLSWCHIHNGCAGVQATDSTVHATEVSVCDIQVRPIVSPGHEGPRRGQAPDAVAYHISGGSTVVKGGSVEHCSIGLSAKGGTAPLTLEGVMFRDCVRGMEITSGVRADVVECEFRGLKRECKRGVLQDLRCTDRLSDFMTGLVLAGCGSSSVRRCVFEGHHCDIAASSPHGIVIQDCQFTGGDTKGVCVEAEGVVLVEGCSMTGAEGVRAQRGATCTIRRCRLVGMTGDCITANECSSVKVLGDTTVNGTADGLVARQNSKLEVLDCHITGVLMGILSFAGGCVLTAERVTVSASVIGVCAHSRTGTPVDVKLIDSEFSGVQAGVHVADTGGSVAVVRCRVSGGHTGIYLGGAVRGRVLESVITRCAIGVVVGETDEDVEQVCEVCGVRGKAALVRAYQALLGTAAASGRCAHDGCVARATLVRVDVEACSKWGVAVLPHGCAAAQNVTARACGIGFFVRVAGKSSTFEECRAIGCMYPVNGRRHVSANDDSMVLPEVLSGVSWSLVE